jgi:hypothetical protein
MIVRTPERMRSAALAAASFNRRIDSAMIAWFSDSIF